MSRVTFVFDLLRVRIFHDVHLNFRSTEFCIERKHTFSDSFRSETLAGVDRIKLFDTNEC